MCKNFDFHDGFLRADQDGKKVLPDMLDEWIVCTILQVALKKPSIMGIYCIRECSLTMSNSRVLLGSYYTYWSYYTYCLLNFL
jgi:hypothetical protein